MAQSRYQLAAAALVLGAGLLMGGCTGVTITIQRATPVAVEVDGAPQGAAPVAASATLAAPTRTTPEAAVEAYLGGIAAGDLDAILGVSAVEEPAQAFDFASYVERLQAMPLLTAPAPAEYPLFAEMNQVRRQHEILSLVRNFAYSLLAEEKIDGSMIAQPGTERVEAFVAAVDPARLAGIEIVEIGTPAPDLLASSRYQENAQGMARIYGADEMTERVALLSFEGDTYLLGFTLLRYGDGWKVMNQTSNLAGTSALGTGEEITPAGFAMLTSGE